jgi:hypothetical protein
MTEEQYSKMMTILVAIYEELHEMNSPTPINLDLSGLEAMGISFEEVYDGGVDD